MLHIEQIITTGLLLLSASLIASLCLTKCFASEEKNGMQGAPLTLLPFGKDFGDTILAPVDDGFSEEIQLDRQFPYFGKNQTTLYVNANGVLSFDLPFTSALRRHFPFSSVPLIAPFWHDFDPSLGGTITYRQTSAPEDLLAFQDIIAILSFVPTIIFIVTWDSVAPAVAVGTTQRNTLQVILATDSIVSAVIFLFKDIQWGLEAQVGFNAGDNNLYYEESGALTPDTLNFDELSNIGVAGAFVYRVDSNIIEVPEDVITDGNSDSTSRGSGSVPTSGTVGSNPGTTEIISSGGVIGGAIDLFIPFGESAGDSLLPNNDDQTSEPIVLKQELYFFGTVQSIVHVNENGVLSFGVPFPNCCGPRILPDQFYPPLIAAYWNDVNLERGGEVSYRQISEVHLLMNIGGILETYTGYSLPKFPPLSAFVATWDKVAPFGGPLGFNTFQVIFVPAGQQSFVILMYGTIQWGSIGSQTGLNAGDGVGFLEVPGSLTEDAVTIEHRSNVGVPGLYIYRIDGMDEMSSASANGSTSANGNASASGSASTSSNGSTSAFGSASASAIGSAGISGSGIASASGSESPSGISVPEIFVPFGVDEGDVKITPMDDELIGPVFLSTGVPFFRRVEHELWINSNGVLSLGHPLRNCCPIPFSNITPPLIAPFWADSVARDKGNIYYRVSRDPRLITSFVLDIQTLLTLGSEHSNFSVKEVFIATWENVAQFGSQQDQFNTFQVLLGSNSTFSYIVFLYGSIQWGEFAQIGVSAGDGVRYLSPSIAGTANAASIEHHSNVGIPGVFVYRFNASATVRECPRGTYISTLLGECLPCPKNTDRTGVNVSQCTCLEGYFRADTEDSNTSCTSPPTACRNIGVINATGESIHFAWDTPIDTGRADYYYIVEYSDGATIASNPLVNKSRTVQHFISGLSPVTSYTIQVISHNGVSDQDSQNEHLRTCQLKVSTRDARPSPPVSAQSFCSVIVWRAPLQPNGDILGYHVQFLSSNTIGDVQKLSKDGTYYIVRDKDRFPNQETFVRVRGRTSAGPGRWTMNIPLDNPECSRPQCPTLPTTYLPTSLPTPFTDVHFSLRGEILLNNSVVQTSAIGEGDEALLCVTNLESCCVSPIRVGEFYYPNSVLVGISASRQGFYRNRGDRVVRLNRRQGVFFPTGRFRCEILNSQATLQTLYISLV